MRAVKSEISPECNLGGGVRDDDVTRNGERVTLVKEEMAGGREVVCMSARAQKP